MKHIKTTFVLSGLLLSGNLLPGQSATALGDSAELHYLADASMVYESNLFLRSARKVSDQHLVFSPGIELKLADDGAASGTLRYQHRFTSYANNSDLNNDFSDFDGRFGLDSGVMVAKGYITYRELASNTIDANRDGILLERTAATLGGSVRYELSQLTSLSLALDYGDTDYDDAFYTDIKSTSIPVTLFYKVQPKVDVTAGYRHRTTDTSGGFYNSVDFTDTYYFVGAVGELFSPVVYADVSVGYQKRDYKGLNLDAQSGSYDISFIYTGSAKAVLTAGFSRDYRTSAVGGAAYAFTSASVGGRYKASSRMSLNASVVIGESDYEESLRAEDMTIINFGASYRPNDYTTIRADWTYSDVDGDVTIGASDYFSNQVRVSAALRY
jgi:hypothetical protein